VKLALTKGALKTIDDHLAAVKVVGPWCCWKVPNRPKEDGYVRIGTHYKQLYVHRAFYEHLIGKIPRGLVPDHLCPNRWCGNPNHVDLVTGQVNTLRGAGPSARNAQKEACVRGHRFTPENTYIYKSGHRACRACLRMHARNYYARSKRERS